MLTSHRGLHLDAVRHNRQCRASPALTISLQSCRQHLSAFVADSIAGDGHWGEGGDFGGGRSLRRLLPFVRAERKTLPVRMSQFGSPRAEGVQQAVAKHPVNPNTNPVREKRCRDTCPGSARRAIEHPAPPAQDELCPGLCWLQTGGLVVSPTKQSCQPTSVTPPGIK